MINCFILDSINFLIYKIIKLELKKLELELLKLQFINFMKNREPVISSIIVDPDINNQKAISTFKKTGFLEEGEITTPNGKSLLMRMIH